MEQKTEREEVVENKTIFELELEYYGGYATVSAKSPEIEAFMNSASEGKTIKKESLIWSNGLEFYVGIPQLPPLPNRKYGVDFGEGNRILFDRSNSLVDVSFLKMKGLGNGVSFKSKCSLSDEEAENVKNDIAAVVKTIYYTYIKRRKFKIVLITDC